MNSTVSWRPRIRCRHAVDQHADGEKVPEKVGISTLTGVSETASLTPNGRAAQARHPHPTIDDATAVQTASDTLCPGERANSQSN